MFGVSPKLVRDSAFLIELGLPLGRGLERVHAALLGLAHPADEMPEAHHLKDAVVDDSLLLLHLLDIFQDSKRSAPLVGRRGRTPNLISVDHLGQLLRVAGDRLKPGHLILCFGGVAQVLDDLAPLAAMARALREVLHGLHLVVRRAELLAVADLLATLATPIGNAGLGALLLCLRGRDLGCRALTWLLLAAAGPFNLLLLRAVVHVLQVDIQRVVRRHGVRWHDCYHGQQRLTARHGDNLLKEAWHDRRGRQLQTSTRSRVQATANTMPKLPLVLYANTRSLAEQPISIASPTCMMLWPTDKLAT